MSSTSTYRSAIPAGALVNRYEPIYVEIMVNKCLDIVELEMLKTLGGVEECTREIASVDAPRELHYIVELLARARDSLRSY